MASSAFLKMSMTCSRKLKLSHCQIQMLKLPALEHKCINLIPLNQVKATS